MRLLYDHQLFSLQNVGGASRYHFELLRYLSALPDVRADLFLGLTQTASPFRELPGVTAWRAPLPPGPVRYSVNEALQTAQSLFRRSYDIYHPTYFRSMPLVRARRMVVTHHDCVYEQFPYLFRDATAVIRSKRRLYARADLILCVSEDSRRGLLQYYSVDSARTCVVHHGLAPLPRSVPAEEELRRRVRRPFLLYVGTRSYHKNFLALLHAFHDARLFEDYDLLALGGGPLSATETAAIASLGLAPFVYGLPSVTDELLAEAYSAATLFVYPSLAEGFGMPPLEAMALGCSVAASYTSAIPEVCRDAPFYFDPTDVASMARVLSQAVGDLPARDRAIARGRAVASGYSWEKCGAATLSAYRTCL